MAGKRKRKYSTPGGGPKKKKYSKAVNVNLVPRDVGSSSFGGPLGHKQRSKLVYSTKFPLGSNQSNVFSLNSVYDPWVSGGGHQPRGLDQIFAMFDHAVVIGCKVEAWAVARTSPVLLTMEVRDSSTTYVDFRDAMENGNTTSVALTSSEAKFMEMNVNPNKFLGVSNPLSDAQMKNSAVGGPTEQAYLHFYNHNMLADGTNPCDVIIRLTYDVIFVEPKSPNIS